MLTPEQVAEYEKYFGNTYLPAAVTSKAFKLILDWRQMNKELSQARAALEEIEAEIDQHRDPAHAISSIKVIVNKAFQSMQESSAEQVREEIKELLQEWDFRGIAANLESGYEQGVLVELVGLCEKLVGINAPEKKTWSHHCPNVSDNLGPQVVRQGESCPFCGKGERA